MRLLATFLLMSMEVSSRNWNTKTDCPSGCSCDTNLVDCGASRIPKRRIPKSIPKNATDLNMNGNSVTKLNNVCRNYGQLRELDLNSNGLTEIKDGAFEDCNNIVILKMRNNKLKEIKKETVSSFQV